MESNRETKPMGSLVVEMGETDYKLTGGSGGIVPGVPIPADTVDSDAIQDGAVEMQDLNQNVKDKMVTDDDRVTQEDLDSFVV